MLNEFTKQQELHANYSTSAVEPETISKNGANLKSHTSRGNLIKFGKGVYVMKKPLNLVAVIVALVMAFSACKKNDSSSNEGGETNLLKNYFTIENAIYHAGSFPNSSSETTLDNANINGTVLAGGSSFVSIDSEQPISEIYVGVQGINGYYSFVPNTTKSNENTYVFVILLSQNLDSSFVIQIAAKTSSGITKKFSKSLTYQKQGTGALQVSLSFDNEKDVDLYVVKPDGVVVYYGNLDDEWEYAEGRDRQICGLDFDSNAGCDIDSVNNENIFYPDDYLQAGKYEVWVNMWENCDPSIATKWSVVTTFKGSRITPTWGSNPAIGTFPVGEPSNSIGSSLSGATKVMEFVISEQKVTKSPNNHTSRPLSESAKAKLNASKN